MDPNFGEARLRALSQRIHVWICESDTNEAVGKRIWAESKGKGYSLERGVTIYQYDSSATPQDVFLDIIGSVDEHHSQYSHDPAWSVLEVYGVTLNSIIRGKLESEFKCSVFSETDNGFIAERSV